MWVLLAIIGAFCQALGMAVTKKALNISGIKNFIAAISFLSGGIFISLIYFWRGEPIWPEYNLSLTFWHWMFWTVLLNIISVLFLYKALKLAELNYLMPFMTLTSLSIIVPPLVLLGEIPTPLGFAGITLVAIGALVMDYRNKIKYTSQEDKSQDKNNRLGRLYFLGTAFCYTISPTTTKLAILESSSLFATFIMLMLLGIAFLLFMIIFGESKRVFEIYTNFVKNQKTKFLMALLLIGFTAAISNWAINVALESARVSYVFSIKRIMPLFAFLIGYFYFSERRNIARKIIATGLMVAGAVLTTLAQ